MSGKADGGTVTISYFDARICSSSRADLVYTTEIEMENTRGTLGSKLDAGTQTLYAKRG